MTHTSLTQHTVPALARRLLVAFEPWFFSGSRPGDSEDTRIRKALLMGGSIIILPVALTWATLYAVFGEWAAAIITFAYAVADLAAILILNRSGRPGLLGFVHQY